MLIDDIKKASVAAMKNRDANARNALSAVISRYTLLATSGSGKEIGDADVVRIIGKVDREIDEEIESFKAAGRNEAIEPLLAQKAALKPYIPQMLGESEIKEIILKLDDRSVPSVMRHFKENYAGRVDMGLVNKTLRTL